MEIYSTSTANASYAGVIKAEFFGKIRECFRFYKEHKQQYDRRIIDNNNWYKSRYMSDPDSNIPEPATPYLFNVIANKHADAMDNYPEPNILERSEGDRQLAEKLTKILPMQLDICDFKKTYSRAWWYKLKNGASCYGVFFNPTLNNGAGDIDIKKIDLLNLFWEPGITDIQDSRFVFLTALVDNAELKLKYPEHADKFTGSAAIEAMTYDDMQNTKNNDALKDKSVVVDCYYKKSRGNRTTVELIKFYDDTILAASEDTGENGIYDHGMYPFVFDVLYPDEDSPVGFGLVDIVKNPQLYIDKLDSIISKNALISGKTRFMIKDNGGLNEYELTDLNSDIIHVAGSVGDENIRELQANPLHNFIIEHRQNKILELKEIAGNRDFQQGGTSGGVTAYSAIVALQQAGEKLARDMLIESYNSFKSIVYLCIELMRQFYNAPRSYRINCENGSCEYISFTGRELNRSGYPGGEHYHPVEFDVSVSGEKNNPYSRIAQNQTLTELWQMGVFNPDQAESAILLLESMHLDGKEKLIEGIKGLKDGYEEKLAAAGAMKENKETNNGKENGQIKLGGEDDSSNSIKPLRSATQITPSVSRI